MKANRLVLASARSSSGCTLRIPRSPSGHRASLRIPASLRTYHVPSVERCPNPTCSCSDSPSGLDIDRKSSLNGSSPQYDYHILVPTGHTDWPSKLEDSGDDDVAKFVKGLFGRGGELHVVSFCVQVLTWAQLISDSNNPREAKSQCSSVCDQFRKRQRP